METETTTKATFLSYRDETPKFSQISPIGKSRVRDVSEIRFSMKALSKSGAGVNVMRGTDPTSFHKVGMMFVHLSTITADMRRKPVVRYHVPRPLLLLTTPIIYPREFSNSLMRNTRYVIAPVP